MKMRDRQQRLAQLFKLMHLMRKDQGKYARMSRGLAFSAAIVGALARLARFALTASPQPLVDYKWAQVNRDGFGDHQNNYAWSMAWFQGKLYVGTGRNIQYVERATIDFFFPELGFYQALVDENPGSPSTPQSLDLRAEIWAYTPETQQWERVFQSPQIPIPQYPDKLVALDIGFRGMTVFREPDGTEALYVAGVTAGEYTPGLPPPRILRSTDGITFEPIPQQPGTVLGDLSKNGYYGFRSMAIYTPPEAVHPRLYITVARGLLGFGVVLEAEDPAKGNNHFRQVGSPDLNVFEMAVFNHFLYVGIYDEERGYAVWKTDATGTPPYQFVPVVTGGAGRGAAVQSVVSMHVFNGNLYVGSNGIFPRLLPPCELIRIHPDDRWELVVGNSRRTSQGVKKPLSSLPDSFGNPLISHFWRMQDHEGVLYLGTNDASGWFQVPPRLKARISHEFGCDLWMSKDGETWMQVMRDGFGDQTNFGARTIVSTPQGLFVGTANLVSGAEVWLVTTS